MTTAIPTTIDEYLHQLRAQLRGADAAMIQDALYDAEEHLRAELAENPQLDERAMLQKVVSSYGAPEEVADIYRVKEDEVERALRAPRPQPRSSAWGRFFAIAVDPRAYAGLFYMLIALATGLFYFTWVVTGISLSIGLSVLIIGIPFVVLFIGTVRALSLVEGKIVEAMLGVRMPRRPLYTVSGQGIWQRIGAMFSDPRTWSTLLYMALMMPLGVIYFSVAVSLLAIGIGLVIGPFAPLFGGHWGYQFNGEAVGMPLLVAPFSIAAGILLLFAVLHLARGVGRLHGQLAKQLLVKEG